MQDLANAQAEPAFGVQRPARRLAQAPAGSQVQVLVQTAADAPQDTVQQVANALAAAQVSGQTLADLRAAGALKRWNNPVCQTQGLPIGLLAAKLERGWGRRWPKSGPPAR